MGILIGVSLGDSFLVANQRDIIELMEAHLVRLREINRQQELELQRWEALKPLVWQSFSGTLAGKKIVIFSHCATEAAGIKMLLEESGAGVTGLLIPAPPEPGQPFLEAENLVTLLTAAGNLTAADLESEGLQLSEAETTVIEWPPDCCLLLLKREALSSGDFFNELWRGLHEHGLRVITLFTWPEQNTDELLLPKMNPEPNLVDNIDTFWGQIALLKMIGENACGHYGFETGSAGLFPQAIQDRSDGD